MNVAGPIGKSRARIALATVVGMGAALGIGGPATAWAPSANDAFADARVIALSYRASEAWGGTLEPGEPVGSCANPNYLPYAESVWFSYTAGESRGVVFAASGDSSHNDSTRMVGTVWQGVSLTSLTEVACDDGLEASYGYRNPQVSFDAVAGETYLIQLRGASPRPSLVRLLPGYAITTEVAHAHAGVDANEIDVQVEADGVQDWPGAGVMFDRAPEPGQSRDCVAVFPAFYGGNCGPDS